MLAMPGADGRSDTDWILSTCEWGGVPPPTGGGEGLAVADAPAATEGEPVGRRGGDRPRTDLS
jgi:hypothetical protein